jgi:photosystem II stability/assembly factor-like uncharacterized protein
MNVHSALFFFSLLWLAACSAPSQSPPAAEGKLQDKHDPSDRFFMQRAGPEGTFSLAAYTAALEEARNGLTARNSPAGFEVPWTDRGPGNLGARINAVAFAPGNPDLRYVDFATGGVFKTTTGGQSWQPVFDDQLFLSVGALAIDPQDENTVYVGTGDPNISGYPFIGDGLWRSQDGGQSWTHLGLTEQRIISKIRIHPTRPDTIWVGTMGLPFEPNAQRGLYRTHDGGQSWQQVLFVSDSAGITDIAMDPTNPDVLYAATWNRIRNNSHSRVNGIHGRVWKSTDGGDQWEMLSGGLPMGRVGRIGLSVSQQNPRKLVASVVGTDHQLWNVYETEDGGATWQALLEDTDPLYEERPLGGFGWYFGDIRYNPYDDNDIFLLGIDLWRSIDGGENWFMTTPPWWQYEVHADKHDLQWIDANTCLLTTDGGIYQSDDNGYNWQRIDRISASDFYRVGFNPHQPDWYYGGAQDQGTSGGTSVDMDWIRIYGGDGFSLAFHPEDPDIWYVETQNGGIAGTVDGGQSWFSGRGGIDEDDRRNWDMPYQLSPHNPDVMYTGTYRMYRSTAGHPPNWEAISPDLTDGNIFGAPFQTISALHESPLQEGLLYVGTTDGNVWRSSDSGSNWETIAAGLPDRYVTDVVASPDQPDWVYAAHSGYKDNEFAPRLFRSTDRGSSWEDISADLPDLAINEILVLPGTQDSVLFVATDGGIYGSIDRGLSWHRLGNNFPYIPVYDLAWNDARNELVAGTYARSIRSFPLDSLNREEEDTTTVQVPLVRGEQAPALTVFPSPAKDRITIRFSHTEPGSPAEIALLSTGSGKLLDLWTTSQSGPGQVDLSYSVGQLPPGTYLIKVRLRKRILTRAFIKY